MILIESDKLIIRDHKIEDLHSYQNLITDRISMSFLPDIFCHSLKEAELSLKSAINESLLGEKRSNFFWGIFLKDGTYLGEIGYTVSSVDTQGRSMAHLGYFIHRSYWNMGYVSEAVGVVIEYAFNKGNIRKLETGCLVDNLYSERIMQKYGFQRETYKKDHQFLDGRWMDRVEYGLFSPNLREQSI